MKAPLAMICLAAALVMASGCTQPNPGPYGQMPPPGPPPGQNPGDQEKWGAPIVDLDAPLPALPEDTPRGEWTTKKFGDVEIRYFSTAIGRGLTESGTDFFIYLKNTGSTPVTLCFPTFVGFDRGNDLLRGYIPAWNTHFFSMQDPPMTLSPGEESRLWYFASIDSEGLDGSGFYTVPFRIGGCEEGAAYTEVNETFGYTDEDFHDGETSYVYGTVTDEQGNPISKADIKVQVNCGRLDFRMDTTDNGAYKVNVLAKEDIDAIYMNKTLACDSTDYFLNAEKDGYEAFFAPHVDPTRAQPQKLDIVLKKVQGGINYTLDWEKQVQDTTGFFWVKPSADWSLFAAAQAKHDPNLNKATNFYMFDARGDVLWKHPTGNECWGLDITGDGNEVVAGCHDGMVYVVDGVGTLLWTYNTSVNSPNSLSRNACFSRDGTKILSGNKPILFDAATGARQDLPWTGAALRNCVFYQDNSGFIVGARELASFDYSGNMEWVKVIGEFPLFLGVDAEKNVYAQGKSRTLFSWNPDGNLRWSHRIPDHTATYGAITPDGSKMALGTVGGMVYLFGSQGNIIWKRNVMEPGVGSAVGHNAVAISDDGKLIIVGNTFQSGESAGKTCMVAYNEHGTIVWKNCVQPDTSNPELILGVTNIRISPDKSQIIATYGDNYVRKFSTGQ